MKKLTVKLTSLLLCVVLCFALCSCDVLKEVVKLLPSPQYGIVEDTSLGYTQISKPQFNYSEFYTVYKCRDAYDILENDKMRELYDVLYENISFVYPQAEESGEYKTKQAIIEECALSEAQVRLTIKALTDDNPQIFWLSSTFGFLIHDEYEYTAVQLYSRYSPQDLENSTKLLEDKVNAFYSRLQDKLSEYEREKKIHDFIIDNCEYDTSIDVSEPETYERGDVFESFGAIVNNLAVCEGYSRAFALLCHGVGIQCLNIIGTSEDQLHMWSGVKLGGDWYYVDTTWDDIDDKALKYDYFNINEKQLLSDHEFSPLFSDMSDEEINGEGENSALTSNFYIPQCDEHAYNYYVRESAHLTDYSGEAVKKSLLKSAQEKSQYFHFYIDTDDSFDDAVDKLFYSYPQYFFEYIYDVNYKLSDYSIDTQNLSFYEKDNLSVVSVVLEYI